MRILASKYQNAVSPSFRMPVDNTASDSISSLTGVAVAFYYDNGGQPAIDAGEAAGTVIAGSLGYRNIRNSLGDMLANYKDTSLNFVVGTDTLVEKEINYTLLEKYQDQPFGTRLAVMTADLENGEYVVDYVRGVIYLKKGSNTAAGTAGFKIESQTIAAGGASGGSGALPVEEQQKPVYENNVDGWADTQFKPSTSTVNKTSVYSNFGSAITANIKGSQGTLFECWGVNNSAGTLYLQFHNTAGVPAGAALPALEMPAVPAGSSFEFKVPFGENGKVGTNGWAMAWSTTSGTYTAAGAAGTQSLQVNYI